jgi:hypothetical protein
MRLLRAFARSSGWSFHLPQLLAVAVLFAVDLQASAPIAVVAASLAFAILAVFVAALAELDKFSVDALSRRAVQLTLHATPRDRDPDAPGHVRPRAPGRVAAV